MGSAAEDDEQQHRDRDDHRLRPFQPLRPQHTAGAAQRGHRHAVERQWQHRDPGEHDQPGIEILAQDIVQHRAADQRHQHADDDGGKAGCQQGGAGRPPRRRRLALAQVAGHGTQQHIIEAEQRHRRAEQPGGQRQRKGAVAGGPQMAGDKEAEDKAQAGADQLDGKGGHAFPGYWDWTGHSRGRGQQLGQGAFHAIGVRSCRAGSPLNGPPPKAPSLMRPLLFGFAIGRRLFLL